MMLLRLALDPARYTGRVVPRQFGVQLQVAFDQPANVLRPVHPARSGCRVHRVFHLRGCRKRNVDVRIFLARVMLGFAARLFGGRLLVHDAFHCRCWRTKNKTAHCAAEIAPIRVTWRATTFQMVAFSRSRTNSRMPRIASRKSRLVAGWSRSSLIKMLFPNTKRISR
jgi:hypothetical protein